LRPSACWVWDWDWVAQGWPLGHPCVTQGSRKGLPSVELRKCFLFNRNGEKAGGAASPIWALHSRQKRPLFQDDRLRRGEFSTPTSQQRTRRGPRFAPRGLGERRDRAPIEKRWRAGRNLQPSTQIRDHPRRSAVKGFTSTSRSLYPPRPNTAFPSRLRLADKRRPGRCWSRPCAAC
jgi:hypothetical protein